MDQKELKGTATKIQYHAGACIRGEKVTAQARKVGRTEVVHGTSTHKIHQMKLEGSVMCVIDRPMNYLRDTTLES
jgi:hypothetical protein